MKRGTKRVRRKGKRFGSMKGQDEEGVLKRGDQAHAVHAPGRVPSAGSPVRTVVCMVVACPWVERERGAGPSGRVQYTTSKKRA